MDSNESRDTSTLTYTSEGPSHSEAISSNEVFNWIVQSKPSDDPGPPDGLRIDPVTGVISGCVADSNSPCAGMSVEDPDADSEAGSEADTPAIRRVRRDNSVVGLEELLVLRKAYREAGRTVVWANGCFGAMHAGHIRALEAASRQGDLLIVGVSGDVAERQPSWSGRVAVPAAERAEVVAALSFVAHVLILEGLTPGDVLARLRPDVRSKDAE